MNQNNSKSKVDVSELTLIMTDPKTHAHFYEHEGRYYTDNREAVKAALFHDLDSPLEGDAENASLYIADITRKGGWEAMIEI